MILDYWLSSLNCRKGVPFFFAKKIEQFFVKNVTFQFTKPTNIPRYTIGFSSQV